MRHFFAGFNRRFLQSSLQLACLMLSGFAYAADANDIGRLLRAGQLDQASMEVERLLAVQPQDAQIRFLKGVIQSQQGKEQDAIRIFTKLTQDFPELPEPYNNLAVLYAGQGQYEQARSALETALRLNPNYATAHENLGDIYAKLASVAYSKALQLDAGNSSAQPKLALSKQIFATSAKVLRPAAAMASVAGDTAAAQAPLPLQPTAEAAPVVAVPVAASVEEQAVAAAVRAWAQAWAKQDTKTYFAAYSSQFRPANGASRSQWEAERKAYMASFSGLGGELAELRVAIQGDKATARFRLNGLEAVQPLAGGSISLALSKEGKHWLIVREMLGAARAAP